MDASRLVPAEVPDGARQLDLERLALLRVGRFYDDRILPADRRVLATPSVTAWAVGGEPVSFAAALNGTYAPVESGDLWGRPWDTVWFRIAGEAPEPPDGCDLELLVDLGFVDANPGFQAEGLAYREDGTVVKGLEPRNAWLPLSPGPFVLLIEAAANPVIGTPYSYRPTGLGDPETAGARPLYRFGGATVVAHDGRVAALGADVRALAGLAQQLPLGARRSELVVVLERMVDAMDPFDVPGTALLGRQVLAPLLAAPAAASALRVHAVGHAHIDSAWLWPVRETKRKVARTVANVLDLIERDPDFVFAMSSAQQYAWLAETRPELFGRLRAAVAAGRFRPVGGMWVESDTNMPGGEALARQLVAGKRYFLEQFGVESDEVWLPDSFGYSAAMPQLCRLAGSPYFLTQKPSWNETNRFPYSSFLWQGIDGSRVFTHFPPAETYNSDLGAADLARTERVFAERGRARHVLALFGYGDGGGGPTREMLDAAHRTADLEGSPRVALSDPHTFFAAAEAELAEPDVWSGELYLELHRGTLISQQRTKRGNRRNEARLHEAELWAATAAVLRGEPYPYDVLEDAWHTVLLLQFHDILPGSSIAWVYRQAEAEHARVAALLESVIGRSLAALGGGSANAAPVPLDGVPAMGIGPAAPSPAVVPRADGDGFAFDGEPQVRVDARGRVVSIVAGGREVVPDGMAAAVLQRFRDTPRQWDAWDIDQEDQRDVTELHGTPALDGDAVLVTHAIGSTRIRVVGGRIELHLRIAWHETQRLLKLAFPLDVQAREAAAEIQFGHVLRPTHRNTSWDTARFETVAHRWIHLSEPGFGVAIANDATYGFDARAGRGPAGLPITTARLSLLRAPVYPDPHADQGDHVFDVSLAVGAIPDAVELGYRRNLPLREARVGPPVPPLVVSSDPAVLVETVKLAEDRSGDVVVRLYEAVGGRATTRITTSFGWTSGAVTDLLERPTGEPFAGELTLRPFQIVTLRFARS